ncbi:hydrolase [Sungkyunkwania multivorans]|uniref:Hydrolase n=1 Tax=Sungkyunkwania multivorans TaxID=1173618 RepID=A0ABW3CX05_9FLAO
MKSRIFMYLFICAALIALWQFTSAKNYAVAADAKIKKMTENVEKYKDSLKTLSKANAELANFTLANDDLGLEYFAEFGYEKVIPYVGDKLIETNGVATSNPLVPYDMMNGKPYIVNSYKIINHRWIVADFTDGKTWGQILVKYFLNDDGSVDFETVESLIYPDM